MANTPTTEDFQAQHIAELDRQLAKKDAKLGDHLCPQCAGFGNKTDIGDLFQVSAVGSFENLCFFHFDPCIFKKFLLKLIQNAYSYSSATR